MNLGSISTIQCVNRPPEPDDRCDDLAWAIANPDICPVSERFIVKPGVALVCELGSINFRAFTVINGTELDVTAATIFQSSNSDVALIGATTGNATGTGAGSATITAAYQDQSAQAELIVMAGTNCCDDITVALLVVVDQSKSMTQAFSSSHMTKLVYAKAAATALVESVNESKDLVGLARFTKEQATVLSDPVADKDAVAALVPLILQTQDDTAFYDAIAAGITSLEATTADRKVLILISDGEDTTPSYVEGPNPVQLADSFKSAGGIFISLGVRAHGSGYSLLSALSTGGFFLNAFGATEDTSIDYLVGLKGYLCAGDCSPSTGGDSVEYQGSLAYTDLINWDISGGGSIDLLGNGFFDYLPGNGLYVDLIGSETPANPLLVSKEAITVVAGEEYRVTARLAGNHVFADPYAMVQIKAVMQTSGVTFIQNILIDDYTSGFHEYLFTFAAPTDDTVKIEIQQIGSIALPIPDPDQMSGILLDSVQVENITHGSLLFDDDFGAENPVYVAPQCGQGTIPQEIGTDTNSLTLTGAGTADVNGDYTKTNDTEWNQVGGAGYVILLITGVWEIQDGSANILYTTPEADFPVGPWELGTGDAEPPSGEYAAVFGYAYGYNCYGDGCLTTPPIAQLSDPNPLPFLESGQVPLGSFDSTRTACESCPEGYINIGPALAGTTLATGEEYQTEVQLDAATAVRRYRVTVNRLWNSSGPTLYLTLRFQGSYDGVGWFNLHTTIQPFALPGMTLTYELPAASTAYAYYRADIGTGFPSDDGKVVGLEVFGDVDALICKEADGEGDTQSAADSAATAAARSLALGELNCMFLYTASATYIATAPDGFTGQASATAVGDSFNSAAEARGMAEDDARDAAEEKLDDIMEPIGSIGGEDGEAIGGEDGEPIAENQI